jgi:hypothetical protein
MLPKQITRAELNAAVSQSLCCTSLTPVNKLACQQQAVREYTVLARLTSAQQQQEAGFSLFHGLAGLAALRQDAEQTLREGWAYKMLAQEACEEHCQGRTTHLN